MARLLIFCFFALSAHARDLDKLYEKAKFRLGKKEFSAYVADDDEGRAQGLMLIEKLPADTGMLFVFDEERVQGFWMKNTVIPLNIGFFDASGKLVDKQEMQPPVSLMSTDLPTYRSAAPAAFALEMNSQWFEKHKIRTGTKLELVSKTKSKLLSKRLSARR